MKVLVTGAGGFLGAAVVKAALRAKIQVVAVSRSATSPRLADLAAGVKRLEMDMADRQGLRAALRAERPDVIVHTAWSGLDTASRTSSAQIERNLVPSCRLVELAAETGVTKFVGIGSQAEYGPLNRKVAEEDLPRPASLYGVAKLATYQLGAEIARQAGMEFGWLRLFAAYGPGDNPNWLIPSLIREFSAGTRPRTSLGTQKWDYLYIDDAADGVIAAAGEPAARGVFNLASGKAVAVRAVVESIRDLTAPDLELVFGEIPFGQDQVMHMEGDIDKLRRATGWSPRVPLGEGLRRTVEAAR